MMRIWSLLVLLVGRCLVQLRARVRRGFRFLQAQLQGLIFICLRIPPFTYDASLGTTEIRLLKLHQRRSHSLAAPALTIETFSLGALPQYFALSYTWGPAEAGAEDANEPWDRHPILLNSRRLDVYRNLFDALCQMASSGQEGYFWIDAICINQDDTTERSNQVAIMDAIYKNAFETIVWLGLESARTARAAAILAASSTIARRESLRIVETGRWGEPASRTDRSGFERCGMPKLSDQDWDALADIYGRRYFGRVWMLQEVALSNDVKVRCGRTSIEWEHVAAIAVFLSLNNSLTGLLLGSPPPSAAQLQICRGATKVMAQHVTRLWCQPEEDPAMLHAIQRFNFTVSRTDRIHTFGTTLFKLLQMNSDFAATDNRDKVFAHYGILRHMVPNMEDTARWFYPDYRLSNADVFARFCRGVITETNMLHVLTYAGDSYPPAITNGPSWVPNFAGRHPTGLHSFFAPSATYAGLNASGPRGDPRCTHVIDGPRLRVSAYRVGEVVAVGETWEDMTKLKLMTEGGTMLARFVAPTYPYTGQSRTEAYWRTLILDQDLASRPASDDVGKSFKEWISFYVLGRYLDLLKAGASHTDAARAHATLDMIALAESPSAEFFPAWREVVGKARRLYQGPCPDGVSRKSFADATVSAWIEASRKFETIAFFTMSCRRVFATNHGHLGCGPQSMDIGNSVWIVAGSPSPLVLRNVDCSGEGQEYQVVGETYVHGIMNGEALTEGVQMKKICLV